MHGFACHLAEELTLLCGSSIVEKEKIAFNIVTEKIEDWASGANMKSGGLHPGRSHICEMRGENQSYQWAGWDELRRAGYERECIALVSLRRQLESTNKWSHRRFAGSRGRDAASNQAPARLNWTG